MHPVGSTKERVQVLADKCNEWQLRINAEGRVEWHVHLVSDGPGEISVNPWTFATGTTVLEPGNAHVIKATHAGGVLKVFTCKLPPAQTGDFTCELGPTPEGTAKGECTECKQFWTNGTAIASGAAAEPTKVECLYGNGKSGGNILWGAEQNAKGNGADKGFSGAMEEMFLSRLSLENITAHLYSCPACGCNNCKRNRSLCVFFRSLKKKRLHSLHLGLHKPFGPSFLGQWNRLAVQRSRGRSEPVGWHRQ